MVRDMIRNCAVSNIRVMSMYWRTVVSMALRQVQKLCRICNFYVYVWISQMMKIKFSEFSDPKDSEIMATGEYESSATMNDERSSECVNERCMVIVHTWDVPRLFNTLDSDCDGIVSAEDVQGLLQKLGMPCISDHNMKMVMGSWGHMSFDEFCSFFLNLWEEAHEHDEREENVFMQEELEKAFSIFDKNGDGFISAWELQRVLLSLGLKEGEDWERCTTMIARYDRNCDGRIDMEEFGRMMTMTNISL